MAPWAKYGRVSVASRVYTRSVFLLASSNALTHSLYASLSLCLILSRRSKMGLPSYLSYSRRLFLFVSRCGSSPFPLLGLHLRTFRARGHVISGGEPVQGRRDASVRRSGRFALSRLLTYIDNGASSRDGGQGRTTRHRVNALLDRLF